MKAPKKHLARPKNQQAKKAFTVGAVISNSNPQNSNQSAPHIDKLASRAKTEGMFRLIRFLDPKNEYLARKIAVEKESHDALRCGHPHGAMKCKRMIACEACPFAEAFEYDVAA